MERTASRGVRVFRHLSVFYIFFLALILVFVFYQYKFKPSNEEELYNRGQGVLNQLSANFLERAVTMNSIFGEDSSTYKNLKGRKNNLGILNQATPFSVENYRAKYDEHLETGNPFLEKGDNGDWQIIFSRWETSRSGKRKIDSSFRIKIVISLKEFASPLFDVRDDIFETYFLVLDRTNYPPENAGAYQIVYNHDEISASPFLNMDTLQSLQKNSDMSAVLTLDISGNKYKAFVQPFEFYGQRLLMVGLMNADDYADAANRTPVLFVPLSIIGILLLLIFLPFVKLFFLGPGESINARDVWSVILSFYLGSSVLLLMIFYMITGYHLESKLETQLRNLSESLNRSILVDIHNADGQLSYFDSVYQVLKKNGKAFAFAGKDTTLKSAEEAYLDSVLAPRRWSGCSRVFWVDTGGTTLAKWNPFNFYAPLTGVSGLAFFTQIMERYPKGDTVLPNPNPVLLNCGKSNITEEFQVYLSKRTNAKIASPGKKKDSVRAFAICMAGDISLSDHVLIPPGFGFCLIDEKGKVLIHSDARRNLSENFIEESGEDPSVMSSWRYKNAGHVSTFRLYGEEVVGSIVPVRGQSLSLVVYYGKEYVSEHVFRAIRFTAVISTTLMLAVLFCLLLTAFENERDSSLPFSLKAIEWARPALINIPSYISTISAFNRLWLGYAVTVGLILIFNLDTSPILFIAILLPFYALRAFILSRNKNTDSRKWYDGMQFYVALIIIGINIIVLRSQQGLSKAGSIEQAVLIVAFQVWASASIYRSWDLYKTLSQKPVTDYPLYDNYLRSLCLSILLVGLLPVTGIYLYAWSSEKIQMSKERLLQVAQKSDERSEYFFKELPPKYKPGVYAALGRDRLSHKKVFERGVFLGADDSLETYRQSDFSDTTKFCIRISDELYYFVNNQANFVTPNSLLFPVQNAAGDTSWKFYRMRKDRGIRLGGVSLGDLGLIYKATPGITGPKNIVIKNLSAGPIVLRNKTLVVDVIVIIFVFSVFIYFGKLLVKNIVDRIFLMNFSVSGKIKVRKEFLEGYLNAVPLPAVDLEGVSIADPVNPEFFKRERFQGAMGQQQFEPGINVEKGQVGVPHYDREDYIIAMTDVFDGTYKLIWDSLSPEEKFVLYDFSIDRLTNYKNAAILFHLIRYGLLVNDSGTLDLFAPSFRNYVLTRTNFLESKESKISMSQKKGVWSILKIPIFSIVSVIGIFILVTQNEATNRLTGLLTSIAALFPLLMKIFEGKAAEGGK